MSIFPTGYTDKGSADSTDKLWASDGVTNFNITVDEIGTEVFADRTTSNLPEGSNLYYTEARVSANATVTAKADQTAVDLKADKSNVLELDNTDVFTPDADYEPATKKYVDDNANPIATNTQAGDATQTTVGINPQQMLVTSIVASDTLQASMDVEGNTPINSTPDNYVKYKEVQIGAYRKTGTVRVAFDIKNNGTANTTAFGRIYVNGSAVGTERSTQSATYVNYSEDISVSEGDLVQFYAYSNTSESQTSSYRNFRVYYDEVAEDRNPTINLDT